MRRHELAAEPVSPCPSMKSGHWNSAQVGTVFWHRRRIGLVLILLVMLPWVPMPGPVSSGGPARRLVISQGDYLTRLAFAPDGRSLATADIQGHAVLNPLEGEGGSHPALCDRGHGRVLAFTPDGHFLLMAGNSAGIARYDLSRKLTERLPGIDVTHTSDLKVAPDGQTLAIASFRSRDIVVWDVGSRRVRLTLQGHQSAVIRLAFSPDGRSLASAASRERHIFIWDVNPQARVRRQLLTPPSLALAYSPDGTLLASASGTERIVRIWDVRAGSKTGANTGAGAGAEAEAGRPVRLIAGHRLPVRSLAFSPDGTLLATASGDGSARLWSVATGRERCQLETHTSILTDIAFSPDGRTLAAAANDANVRFWDLSRLVPDQFGSE